MNNKITMLLEAEIKPEYITRLEGRLSQKRLIKPNHPVRCFWLLRVPL